MLRAVEVTVERQAELVAKEQAEARAIVARAGYLRQHQAVGIGTRRVMAHRLIQGAAQRGIQGR